MTAPDSPSVLVNGSPVDAIPVSDRGFHYADALFETLRLCGDGAPLWSRHMARLAQGCERLGLPSPDPAQLADECARVAGGRAASVCKIIYSRGSGGHAYTPPVEPVPLRVVMASEAPPLSEAGLAVTFCRTPVADNPLLAGLKHTARLEQVLARRELAGSSFDEGLMCDPRGRVIEATAANLFVLQDDILYTPALRSAGVAGVMRAVVLEMLQRHGHEVQETHLEPADCRQARALFLCNAVRGIMPVARLETRALEIPSWVLALTREIHTLLGTPANRTGEKL